MVLASIPARPSAQLFALLWMRRSDRIPGIMIFQGRFTQEFGLTMAAAAVCTVPIILAFLVFQKRITEGIAMTGLKG